VNEEKFNIILNHYAELIVKVCLNLQPEQRLFIYASPLEVAPLVRKVTEAAYKNGSKLVSINWIDEQIDKIRLENAPKDSFEEYPNWEADGVIQSAERGDAFLYVWGKDPDLLKDVHPDDISKVAQVHAKYLEKYNIQRGKGELQWLIVNPPTPAWAARVFPDDAQEDAEEKLWDAVIKACRLDEENPVEAWTQQFENLGKRKEYLTDKQYSSLRLTAPGTDLSLGLPDRHIWEGGSPTTTSGISFVPNLPTEEVFTSPHRGKTSGVVSSTKPLSFQGKLIENFQFTFENGKVVDFSAEKGEEALQALLDTDEPAKFLGEVALVPHQTPISQLGLTFLNTLYDENASNHLALGRSFRFCLEGGGVMSDEEYVAAGGNKSLIHVDFMIGSGEMNVDGMLSDGTMEAIMKDGEWAFEV
jgi:aminopeptidase